MAANTGSPKETPDKVQQVDENCAEDINFKINPDLLKESIDKTTDWLLEKVPSDID